ncbi:MAG: division/cell wall cluster transcriptional repressor MraZ [Lachnospiraceae bacterium]|nr:division/cell wall cluster transcriptional repressor MraZ [Lachnospiraceae bacterium]MBR3599772.1 division/cell wall cluster transcriptional repressor MraZ [Lachnospiraceae bacterium]
MTGLLLGQSNHSLDAKGRLIVPIRLRQGLGAQFIMCNGHGDYIQLFPLDQFEKFAATVSELDVSDEENRQYQNFFFASASVCEPDGQYRIVIPQQMREEKGIDKEVVLVGNMTSAQLWSKEAWDAHYKNTCDNISDISKNISRKTAGVSGR